jgi:hypothetical protein
MERIRQIIRTEVDRFNEDDHDGINVAVVENHLLKKKSTGFAYDGRLDDPNYSEEPISLVFFDKGTQETKAITTLLLFKKIDFPQVKFWYHDRQTESLKRFSIDELDGDIGDCAMTIGYTQSDKPHKKFRASKFFISIVHNILVNTNVLVFIECTGLIFLDSNVTRNSELTIRENGLFKREDFGITRKESKTVEKFVRLINLKKAENIYNLWTLGNVYFSREVKYSQGSLYP